ADARRVAASIARGQNGDGYHHRRDQKTSPLRQRPASELSPLCIVKEAARRTHTMKDGAASVHRGPGPGKSDGLHAERGSQGTASARQTPYSRKGFRSGVTEGNEGVLESRRST